jgi:hypothetical protein
MSILASGEHTSDGDLSIHKEMTTKNNLIADSSDSDMPSILKSATVYKDDTDIKREDETLSLSMAEESTMIICGGNEGGKLQFAR